MPTHCVWPAFVAVWNLKHPAWFACGVMLLDTWWIVIVWQGWFCWIAQFQNPLNKPTGIKPELFLHSGSFLSTKVFFVWVMHKWLSKWAQYKGDGKGGGTGHTQMMFFFKMVITNKNILTWWNNTMVVNLRIYLGDDGCSKTVAKSFRRQNKICLSNFLSRIW